MSDSKEIDTKPKFYEIWIGAQAYTCTDWRIDLANGWAEIINTDVVQFIHIGTQNIVVPNILDEKDED